MNVRDRYGVALRQAVQVTADALAEVDAEAPLLRHPLYKRILWRYRGVPADVRAEELFIAKTRAQLLMVAIQKRKP